MTPVVLVVLVVLWIVVLAPGLIKKQSERKSSTSIDSFHHQLHLLERTGPKLVAPACRLEPVSGGGAVGPAGSSGLPTITSRPGRPKLVLVGRQDDSERESHEPVGVTAREGAYAEGAAGISLLGWGPSPGVPREWAPFTARASRPGPRRAPDPYRRRQLLKRRRQIFAALVATFLLTTFLGAFHSFRALWVVTVISALGLAGYLALISYARRLVVERRETELTRALVAERSVRRDDDAFALPRLRRPAHGNGRPAYETLEHEVYNEPRRAAAAR